METESHVGSCAEDHTSLQTMAILSLFFLSVIFLYFERSITRLSYKDIGMSQRNEVYRAFCGAKVTESDQRRVNPTQQILGLGDIQHLMCTLY